MSHILLWVSEHSEFIEYTISLTVIITGTVMLIKWEG